MSRIKSNRCNTIDVLFDENEKKTNWARFHSEAFQGQFLLPFYKDDILKTAGFKDHDEG